jgi:hypothetical protein
VKIVAISPQPSDDEAAAITAALERAYAARANGSPHARSRWRSERKLAGNPAHNHGGDIPALADERRLNWCGTARLEALDAGV